MQQCCDVLIDIYHEFFLLFYCCVLLEIKLTTTTITVTHNERDGVSNHSWLFTQPFVQAQIKENIKSPCHCSLWGESTGDRWIPLTKGQWRGKVGPIDVHTVLLCFVWCMLFGSFCEFKWIISPQIYRQILLWFVLFWIIYHFYLDSCESLIHNLRGCFTGNGCPETWITTEDPC